MVLVNLASQFSLLDIPPMFFHSFSQISASFTSIFLVTLSAVNLIYNIIFFWSCNFVFDFYQLFLYSIAIKKKNTFQNTLNSLANSLNVGCRDVMSRLLFIIRIIFLLFVSLWSSGFSYFTVD